MTHCGAVQPHQRAKRAWYSASSEPFGRQSILMWIRNQPKSNSLKYGVRDSSINGTRVFAHDHTMYKVPCRIKIGNIMGQPRVTTHITLHVPLASIVFSSYNPATRCSSKGNVLRGAEVLAHLCVPSLFPVSTKEMRT